MSLCVYNRLNTNVYVCVSVRLRSLYVMGLQRRPALMPPKNTAQRIRHKNVCFTVNGPLVGEGDLADIQWHHLDCVEFYVYQHEVSASNRHHWQGYMELKNRQELAKVKLILGSNTAHIEERRGTQQQAIDYSTKEDTRFAGTQPIQWGTPLPQQAGKRTDLIALIDKVKTGERLYDLMISPDVCDTVARHFQYTQKLVTMHAATHLPQVRQVIMTIFYGPTGTGKSRRVRYIENDALYSVPLGARVGNGWDKTWFCGYDAHEAMLYDDFVGQIDYATMLRYLDKYACDLPRKNGLTQCAAFNIYITSNLHPRQWYPEQFLLDGMAAFFRRAQEDGCRIEHMATEWTPPDVSVERQMVKRPRPPPNSDMPPRVLDEAEVALLLADEPDVPRAVDSGVEGD